MLDIRTDEPISLRLNPRPRRARRAGLGRWVVRGFFLTLHAAIFAFALAWTGTLTVPEAVRDFLPARMLPPIDRPAAQEPPRARHAPRAVGADRVALARERTRP
jgi:hypothetical protein